MQKSCQTLFGYLNPSDCCLYMAEGSLSDEERSAKLQKVASAAELLDGNSEETELSEAQEECEMSETSQEYEKSRELAADEPILVCFASVLEPPISCPAPFQAYHACKEAFSSKQILHP